MFFLFVGLQVESEDAAVCQLWSVVPRGLHSVFNQAIAVWGQVRHKAFDMIQYIE